MLLTAEKRRVNPDLKRILKATVRLFSKTVNLDYIYDLEDELRHTKASLVAVEWLKKHKKEELI